MSERRSRFAGDLNEGIIVRPEDQVDADSCACGCGGPGCWDPHVYVSDRRSSEALAEHLNAVTALVDAVDGVGIHPIGAAARGDDVVGDELSLRAWFDVVPDPVELIALAEDLEDLLEVGVQVVPVAPTRRALVVAPDAE